MKAMLGPNGRTHERGEGRNKGRNKNLLPNAGAYFCLQNWESGRLNLIKLQVGAF